MKYYDELVEFLADFALEEGLVLKLTKESSRDGEKYIETMLIRSEDIKAFSIETTPRELHAWQRK